MLTLAPGASPCVDAAGGAARPDRIEDGSAAKSAVVLAAAKAPRATESFNDGWRFARFGPMPDGSRAAEPGGFTWAFRLTASSEEIGRGNLAEHAMDGKADTRWCAAGPAGDQWLQIDMGKPYPVGKVSILWETDGAYRCVQECSMDGKRWSEALGAARYIRIRVTGVPDGKWASIREVRLFDNAGREMKNTRVESAESPAKPGFDDSAWRRLNLPHDWGIEGPFRYDIENSTGKLPWRGIGWYRKRFVLPAADRGRRVVVEFDGAMAYCEVWINGRSAGGWPYGYQGFQLDLTPFVKFGEENVIAVRLDTVRWGARWYPGAGLYRNVRLTRTGPVHVGQWGVRLTTPSIEPARGEVAATVTVDNQSAKPVEASVQVEIRDGKRKVAESAPAPVGISPDASAQVLLKVTVSRPKLWDTDTPRLYLARVVVRTDGKVIDTVDTPFGFRTLEFTARDGFKLNGRRVEIRGTCNHHDLGALGAAVNRRALERQLEMLKEMGCNALRTSHNPPAPELLELADRMGFLVQCEAFDSWRTGKVAEDYYRLFEAWHEKDLRAMVRHFANHPSVFMWSIGNEVVEQDGPDLARPLAAIVRDEDPTRPVTAGCNNVNAAVNGFQTAVDVFGMNYNGGEYGRMLSHPGNEKKPMHASESSSCTSSRGEYFFPVKRGEAAQVNFQVSSYDVDGPPWACPPDDEFAALARHPAFLGEFVWTGFDYLGEPTPYNNDVRSLLNFSDPALEAAMRAELGRLGKIRVPSRSSYFGIIDLAGFRKDRFYAYQARWRPELPMAHILPHWNWPERVGKITPVHVYTSGDEAELFLNGRSLGRRKKGEFEYRLRWDDVSYQPGELRAVAYRRGAKWAEDTVKTTGEPAKVTLSPDRTTLRADGQDLSFVTVGIGDREGLIVPRTHNLVKFEIAGPGDIAAVDNGDATSFEPFQAKERQAFNGLCLVIVRAKAGEGGTITLRAASEGLASAAVAIGSKEPGFPPIARAEDGP